MLSGPCAGITEAPRARLSSAGEGPNHGDVSNHRPAMPAALGKVRLPFQYWKPPCSSLCSSFVPKMCSNSSGVRVAQMVRDSGDET